MTSNNSLHLGALEAKLQRLPFAFAISNMSAPDHPLLYVNDAFTQMTGYGTEILGQNCRLLQSDLPNETGRAEARKALSDGTRTQTVLHNRRKNGESFYNLLLLEKLQPYEGLPQFAIGSQFDLGPEDPNTIADQGSDMPTKLIFEANTRAHALKLERRRLVSQAALRIVESWCILNAVTAHR